MSDPINHPSHYTDGKIEVIDFIEDKKLGYHLGNVVKYICRAGKKDKAKEVEDLKKASWYLTRYINGLEAQKKPFQYSDESIMQITAEKQREAFCKQWKESGKPCHECELGRTANMQYIGCSYFAKLHPDEAIQIMRKVGE